MGKDKKIWIVVPVFNRSAEIYCLLKDLYNQTYSDFNVVVVDHGMERVDFSLVTDSRVKVLLQSSDLWWTGAINRGLEHVFKKKEKKDFILIINDDVALDTHYLENIVMAGEKYPDAIIGGISVDKITGLILNADNRLDFFRAGYKSSWQGKMVEEIKEDFVKSDILSGRGMLIPDSVIEKNGMFNETELPHYGADNEFTWRANKKRIDVFCSKNCVAYTLPKEKSLYQFKMSFKEFVFDTRKPGNLKAVSQMAFLCFSQNYARYFIAITSIKFLISYIKQFVKLLSLRGSQ